MSFWTVILLIVIVACITGVVIQRYEVMGRSGRVQSDEDRRALEDERNASREEIRELRERVRTLERIATDPSRRTAEEIEKLRDD